MADDRAHRGHGSAPMPERAALSFTRPRGMGFSATTASTSAFPFRLARLVPVADHDQGLEEERQNGRASPGPEIDGILDELRPTAARPMMPSA